MMNLQKGPVLDSSKNQGGMKHSHASLSLFCFRYAASIFSIRGPQRSPLQSPLPDPTTLFTSWIDAAPFFMASMKRFRGIPMQMQIVSFWRSHALLRSSGSI
jgi:hypothetical protein